MRIGIITFHNATNYGAVLQCYALSNFLRGLGHDVKIIDYHRKMPSRGRLSGHRAADYPVLAIRKMRAFLNRRVELKRQNIFREFIARELPLTTQKYIGVENLRELPPECDIYICGSDQIWNDHFWNGFDEAYFLAFGDKSIRRIAYAPGVPGCEFKFDGIERFRELISGFDAISAREKIGQKLISDAIGIKAPIVVDPTILFNDYNSVLREVSAPRKFILSYTLPISNGVYFKARDCVKFLRQSTNLSEIAIEIGKTKLLTGNVYCPFEWLWLIKNSTFFVTNSYHGLIFALLFKKDFLIVPRDGKASGQDARLLFLLERYDLIERYITEENKLNVILPIDWDRVHALMENERLFSSRYIKKALVGEALI